MTEQPKGQRLFSNYHSSRFRSMAFEMCKGILLRVLGNKTMAFSGCQGLLSPPAPALFAACAWPGVIRDGLPPANFAAVSVNKFHDISHHFVVAHGL
jgi:hypothetical protein